MRETTEIFQSVNHDYELLRSDAVQWRQTGLSLFELTGEDRSSWLQGQATNDCRLLRDGGSLSFCLCSSTGQVEAIVDLWALGDSYWLTTQTSTAPSLLRRVEETVIMEDVSIVDRSAEFDVVSVQGANANIKLAVQLPLPPLDAGIVRLGQDEVKLFRSRRTVWGGWDLWTKRGHDLLATELKKSIPEIWTPTVDVARLEAGIPLAGQDYHLKTLAPELGPSFEARHISYTKGCYTGQEVLMRIHSRGHTNRTWVGLICDSAVEPGFVIGSSEEKHIGQVTSASHSPQLGCIAAGYVRNEFSQTGRELWIRPESDGKGFPIRATCQEMPLLTMGT